MLFVSEIIDRKKRGYLNAEKAAYHNNLDSQHIKASETLHKFSLQYFCHIFDHSEKKLPPKILL